jgi:hypothetical protein
LKFNCINNCPFRHFLPPQIFSAISSLTKDSLSHKKLGEELLVDIAKYKEYPNCDQFVIFIYDRIDKIPNKAGFKNDLEKQSTTKMKVHAVINPL